MKKVALSFLSSILLFCINTLYAQSTYFYYTENSEKVYLNKSDTIFSVEYPNGLYIDTIYPGTFSFNNHFKITATDTNDVDSFGNNPIIWPVFTTNDSVQTQLTVFGEIILLFNDGVDTNEKNTLVNGYNLSLVDSSTSFLSYSTDDSVFEKCQAIYETGLVKYCYPNFAGAGVLDATIPNDPYFSKQYYLYNTGQTINDGRSGTSGADIKVTAAWDITKGSNNVKIAIIDNGVEGNHPDLPSSKQLRLNGSNTCLSQHANNNPNDPEPYADEAHGTAIAGIINAAHNNEGIAGICPDCKIMPVRYVIGYAQSYHVKAFDFAVQNGADIISSSISYGPPGYPAIKTAYENAVKAGVLICQSVGNTANRINNDNGYPLYPSAYNLEHVISVGSSNRYDKQSNYSPTTDAVTLTATSNHSFYDRIQDDSWDIWTTDRINNLGYNSWPGPPFIMTNFPAQYEILPNSGTNNLQYTGRFGGTSAAAPQVAAVAGLMKSVNQCLGVSQMNDILVHTTDMVGGYSYFPSNTYESFRGDILKANHSPQLGHGRINAYKAVKAAQDVYKSGLDLYIKDNEFDFGDKKSSGGDKSPDIWVRGNGDGFTKKSASITIS